MDFGKHCHDPFWPQVQHRTATRAVERTSRRRVGVAVGLGLVVALAGCGSGADTVKPAAPTGADPVAWMGVFCEGLGEVVSAAATAANSPSTPQGEKDALLTQADATRAAFAAAAQKLAQLGPPGVTGGKQAQDSAVSIFTTAANTVADRRTKLAALDPKSPDFEQQKTTELTGPELGSQVQKVMSNNELTPAFGEAPQCQQLSNTAGHQ
jgi:hypothetical protein